jgi:PAS domain S-box-containing protein
MGKKSNEYAELSQTVEELQKRLIEAEDTLGAIRRGEVDALVIETSKGDQVFTLKSAERPYRIMVEQMTEGALTLSLDGIILFCNQRFAQMVQAPLETLIAASIYQYIAPDSRSHFDVLAKNNARGEMEFLAQSKTAVPTNVALSTLKLDEDTTVLCVVVTDLTEHKQAEDELARYREGLEYLVKQRTAELEKINLALQAEVAERKKIEDALYRRTQELESANSELEAFSYSVSHDLRAPLRSIEGFSEAAVMEYADKLGEQGQDYLIRVRKASRTMSSLIDDILKLSRVSRADMHTDRVDLSRLVDAIARDIRAAQPERRGEIKVYPGVTVNADRRLVEIALRNLLENAWKFTSKCPQPYIEFGVTDQAKEMVYFIKDNGVGFSMKYADKLFEPFRRLHSEKDYPGTGIGLATVRRIIRRHGGQIWAESKVGKGATFYFTLG